MGAASIIGLYGLHIATRRAAAPGLGCDATSTEARVGPVSGGTARHNRDHAPPGNSERSVRVGAEPSQPDEKTSPESTMANKGILGRKLGMTQVFDEGNRVVPVTVIEAGPCRVVQLKTPERDGYAAVQLAFGETKAQRLSKPELGHLKAGRTPTRRSTSPSCASTTSRASSSARC